MTPDVRLCLSLLGVIAVMLVLLNRTAIRVRWSPVRGIRHLLARRYAEQQMREVNARTPAVSQSEPQVRPPFNGRVVPSGGDSGHFHFHHGFTSNRRLSIQTLPLAKLAEMEATEALERRRLYLVVTGSSQRVH